MTDEPEKPKINLQWTETALDGYLTSDFLPMGIRLEAKHSVRFRDLVGTPTETPGEFIIRKLTLRERFKEYRFRMRHKFYQKIYDVCSKIMTKCVDQNVNVWDYHNEREWEDY